MGRLGLEGSVAIEVCGATRMAGLNRRFRKKAGPTDVLAFPGGEPDESGQPHLGDLALCTAVVAANAERLGHGFEAEFKKVLLHGMLHLAGYDHEVDRGQMRRRERALASCLDLPR
jgi:probable rRNA maturation factor